MSKQLSNYDVISEASSEFRQFPGHVHVPVSS